MWSFEEFDQSKRTEDSPTNPFIENEVNSDKTSEHTEINDQNSPKIELNYENVFKVKTKITILEGDITKLQVDAVVNAANKTLLGTFFL